MEVISKEKEVKYHISVKANWTDIAGEGFGKPFTKYYIRTAPRKWICQEWFRDSGSYWEDDGKIIDLLEGLFSEHFIS